MSCKFKNVVENFEWPLLGYTGLIIEAKTSVGCIGWN